MRPSAVTATASTELVWPVRVARSVPRSRSQTLRVPSYDPDTAVRPSAVTATASTTGMAGEGGAFGAALQVPDLEGAIP